MPEINLEKTVRVDGGVFFAGKAFVTEDEKRKIEAKLKEEEEAEQPEESETPKKGRAKTKTE